jgi:DedD protein
MRSAFQEEDEDELAPRQHADRELTLSSTTLLVIFFGLVLICGLFFGFGYTLGRRAPSETPDAVAAAEPAAPLPASSGQPKPSAASASPAPVDSAQDTADTTAETPAENASPAAVPTVQAVSEPVRTGVAGTGIQPALSVSQTKQTSQLSQPTVKPALATTSPAAAPAATGTIMVQIAAVSNAADADVLLGALRKRGYSVGVRNQPGDALLHVQIGPFASRAEAIAMRQKLLGDGYNAILK